MEKERNVLIDVSITQSRMKQTANSDLGITQEYNKENRDKLWDSTKGKAEYKEKVFGDKETYEDKISGNVLHKSQKAAQRKYHQKNSKGENVSTAWANHSAETDHINPLKDFHDKKKYNGFLSDSDFKEIMNSDENYRILSKSENASKGEKSDWEMVFDKDKSLEARKQIAKEKIKSDVTLHKKFAVRTAKNVGNEFITGAKDTVVDATIPLTVEAVNNMIQVAQGKKELGEAAKDMGKTTVDVAIAGGTNKVLVTALTNTMSNSKNAIFQKIANSNEVAQIIAVASIVKESAVRYVNGEINGTEFINEVGEKGTTMVAGMLGGQFGKKIGGLIGGVSGTMAGPAGVAVGHVAGQVIGEVLGTLITTAACSAIMSVYHISKNIDSYKLKEKQIKRLESEALREMGAQREKFREIVARENEKYEKEIQEGFDMIFLNACKESYSLEGVTEGLDKVLAVFGKNVAFKTLEQYESQLDETLKLSF